MGECMYETPCGAGGRIATGCSFEKAHSAAFSHNCNEDDTLPLSKELIYLGV